MYFVQTVCLSCLVAQRLINSLTFPCVSLTSLHLLCVTTVQCSKYSPPRYCELLAFTWNSTPVPRSDSPHDLASCLKVAKELLKRYTLSLPKTRPYGKSSHRNFNETFSFVSTTFFKPEEDRSKHGLLRTEPFRMFFFAPNLNR